MTDTTAPDLVNTTSGFTGTAEQLRNALSEVEDRGGQKGAIAGAARDRIEALEAENAKLREALERIVLGTYDGLEVTWTTARQARSIARDALATPDSKG